MRLAWFSPTSLEITAPADDTALLVRALGARHRVEVIDASRAHDFVWQHARSPFDLCVFELGGSPAHRFIAPYAIHYPGVVMLRGVPRHDRALQAARLVVVPHEPVAQALADDYPGVRVRTLVPGVDPLPGDAPAVITALTWPPNGTALTYAMAGFAAARAVIVFDGPETADWPSLNPQNWQPRDPLARLRGFGRVAPRPDEPALAGRPRMRTPLARQAANGEPICVSIDPRDEAHSLRLAVQRLDGDPALRERLGAAAQTWWREHATVEMAAKGFELLLQEARDAPDPIGVDADDGTSLARSILAEFGPGPWALSLGPF